MIYEDRVGFSKYLIHTIGAIRLAPLLGAAYADSMDKAVVCWHRQ